ncbi:MAG: diacylglycerol kinase family protein [Candidatus Krumholzibacteriota bacterium]
MSRLLVIANPYSGNARKRTDPGAVAGRLREMGHEVETHLTTGPGDATVQAGRAAGNFDLVVALGGDGTVHETATGLAGTGCTMAVLPSGSGNDFATGIGCATVEAGLAAIGSGHDLAVDVCALDGEKFVNTLGLFASGLVSGGASHLWRWLGGARYTLAAVATLLKYRGQDVAWEVGGVEGGAEEFFGRFFFAEICNGPLTGGGFRFAPDARFDDGLLDACLIRPVGPVAGLKLLPAASRGDRVEHEAISVVRCRSLAFTSDEPVAVHLDGEPKVVAAGRHVVEVLDEKLIVRMGKGPR